LGTFVTGALAAIALGGSVAVRAQPSAPSAAAFGVPPSDEVPILFNDHHVYVKPDPLEAGHVLVAIVRHGTILVPMRSMFEQTGATVTYDRLTHTVDVSKPGADVKVTVGKASVFINGKELPLDVPPEVYRGNVVVPLRVISEGMGAYVQWVSDRHLVAVRYVASQPIPPPPTPVATPTAMPQPTVTPTAAPTPTSAATAPRRKYERYVSADYIISPKVYNELSPGNTGSLLSYSIKGNVEFPLFGPTWEAGVDYRHFIYPHTSRLSGAAVSGTCPAADPGCVTEIGYPGAVAATGLGQVYVTAFSAQENDVDAHFGVEVLSSQHVYVAVSQLFRNYNYLGYPNLYGIGFGLEKLPELEDKVSVYGSAFYFPHVSGSFAYPRTAAYGPLGGERAILAYGEWKYELGATIAIGSTVYIDLGYLGERDVAKSGAPSDTSVAGPYVGLGLHF
jgi:hypothetical protein